MLRSRSPLLGALRQRRCAPSGYGALPLPQLLAPSSAPSQIRSRGASHDQNRNRYSLSLPVRWPAHYREADSLGGETMTAKESKALKVDDCVMWDDDPMDLGIVIETGYRAVKISWENGQVGIVDHRGMTQIQVAPK